MGKYYYTLFNWIWVINYTLTLKLVSCYLYNLYLFRITGYYLPVTITTYNLQTDNYIPTHFNTFIQWSCQSKIYNIYKYKIS